MIKAFWEVLAWLDTLVNPVALVMLVLMGSLMIAGVLLYLDQE